MSTTTLTIENRGGTLYAKGTVAGKRVNRSLHLPASVSKVEAKAAVKRIEDKLSAPAESFFSDIAEAYVAWKEMEGKDTRSPDFKYRIPALIEKIGKQRPSEIDVALLIRSNMKGKTAGTIKKTCNILKAILRFGVEHGMTHCVPSFPKIKVNDARDQSLTSGQVKSFIEYVKANHPDSELMAAILVDAGLRVNECCALLSHDLDGDSVVVKSKANGKAKLRVIPQSTRIQAAIHRTALPAGRLFRITPNAASKKMAAILEGFCKKEGIERIRVHDLRHTFARQCGEAGVDLAELQHLMGHSTIAMTVRYRGFIASRAVSAIKNFGD